MCMYRLLIDLKILCVANNEKIDHTPKNTAIFGVENCANPDSKATCIT